MTTTLLNSTGTHVFDCSVDSAFTLFWIFNSGFCFCLGLPVTLMALKVLYKRLIQKVANEIFMLNLELLDLLYIILIPLSVITYTLGHQDTFQRIVNVMDGLFMCGKPLFLAGICMESYFAVFYPIRYRMNNKSRIIRTIIAMVVWAVIVCYILLKCFVNWSKVPVFDAISSFIALPFITFCNISILGALKKSGLQKKSIIHPQKKRALRNIINKIIATLFTYLPGIIIFSFADLIALDYKEYDCKVAVFAYSFSTTGCVLIPFVYLDTVGKLNNLKRWLKCVLKKDKASNSTSLWQ